MHHVPTHTNTQNQRELLFTDFKYVLMNLQNIMNLASILMNTFRNAKLSTYNYSQII